MGAAKERSISAPCSLWLTGVHVDNANPAKLPIATIHTCQIIWSTTIHNIVKVKTNNEDKNKHQRTIFIFAVLCGLRLGTYSPNSTMEELIFHLSHTLNGAWCLDKQCHQIAALSADPSARVLHTDHPCGSQKDWFENYVATSHLCF